MKNPLRNIQMLFRRRFGSGIARLDGVKIDTRPIASRLVRNLVFKGIYESDERRLLSSLCEPEDRVLEIGAGIGVIGLVAARLCPRGAVVSYEANPRMRAVIEANYALNPVVPEIVMMPITLEGGDVTFNLSEDIISSSSLERSDGPTSSVALPSRSLAEAVALHRPNVLVMDIEGYEEILLTRGDLEGIGKLLVEFHPHVTGAQTVNRVQAHVESLGFRETGRSGNNVAYRRDEASPR